MGPRHCHYTVGDPLTHQLPQWVTPPAQVAAVIAVTTSDVVNAEFCPDSAFFRYLEEQKRIRH